MTPLKNDKGTVVLYVTLALTLMVLFIGVSIDVGWMTYVRNQGQAVVDAAALAGTTGVPKYFKNGDTSDVEGRIVALNESNMIMEDNPGLSLADVEFVTYDPLTNSITPAANAKETTGIRVTHAIATPLFFANFLNDGNGETINVQATAVLTVGRVQPNFPLALLDCNACSTGQCNLTEDLDGFLSQSSSTSDDSAFTTYFSGASASTCRNMVIDPSLIPEVNVGDLIHLNNGQVTSCLHEMETKCKELKCSPTNPWYRILPVISCADLKNNPVGQARVVAFAEVGITDIKATEAGKKVLTLFRTCATVVPGPGGGGNCGLFAEGPILVE